LIFNIFDTDGDNELSILDLEWMRARFSRTTDLGKGIEKLYEMYMNKNVRPKYVKERTVIDFQIFFSNLTNCQLIQDLDYAFNVRPVQEIRLKECMARSKSKIRHTRKRVTLDSLENDPDLDEKERQMLDEYRYYHFSFNEEEENE